MRILFTFYLLILSIFPLFGQLGYTCNKGQVYNELGKSNENVKFLYKKGNFQLEIRSTGISYEWFTKVDIQKRNDGSSNSNLGFKVKRLDYEFFGIDPRISWEGEDVLSSWENYYNHLGAQCKIYQGKYASGTPIAVFIYGKISQGKYASGKPVGVTEGNKIYRGKYASGTPVGVIEGNKVYQGKYASGTPIATIDGGGVSCAFAAAAYLLLL